jgi:hypothetical protein
MAQAAAKASVLDVPRLARKTIRFIAAFGDKLPD